MAEMNEWMIAQYSVFATLGTSNCDDLSPMVRNEILIGFEPSSFRYPTIFLCPMVCHAELSSD